MKWKITSTAALAAVLWVLFPMLPKTAGQRQRSIAQVECRWCYTLEVNGKPALYLRHIGAAGNEETPDWSATAFSTEDDSLVCDTCFCEGRWVDRWLLVPSCRGRIRIPDTFQRLDSMAQRANDSMRPIVGRQLEAFDRRLRQLTRASMELDYYLNVHNVTDEGYNAIAAYADDIVERKKNTARALAALQRIEEKDSLSIRLVRHFSAVLPADSAQHGQMPCLLLSKRRRGDLLLQTADRRSPRGIYANYLSRPPIQPQATPTPRTEYDGETANGQREGHGILQLADGTYYNGLWKAGQRSGFGFATDTVGDLRVGEWRDDRYLGERLTYTNERIYGIDISRYQHDIGKKRYAINWPRVRIAHLGTKSSKRISGAVDYPVRFCYIKSTEGTSIRNRYFAADYANAKKQGIRTGAYHFFSTKSGGAAQASFFLKHTNLRRGDLPPVLDVEPSAAQIRAMGGTGAMFGHIRTWLRTVEQRTGTKPILYVSQTFVNKYLVEAPDIKRDYQVWIARYGEYKPDVHLAIWQLCPDGRVSGIRGAVDINVFNGYEDQFQEFLEACCIK